MTRATAHPAWRRATALLLVLATLALAVTACAAVARMAGTAAVAARVDAAAQAAHHQLVGAEAIIIDWLQERAGRVTLPPDADAPEVPVFAARWTAADVPCILVITAYDQRGMVPAAAIFAGSPLRHTLPREALRAVDDAPGMSLPGVIPGLDLLVAAASGGTRIFPSPTSMALLDYDTESTPALQTTAPRPAEQPPLPPAVGALVATHTGDEFAHGRGGGSLTPTVQINVNTAPMPLVEAVMRLSQRSGIEAIAQAREAGRLAPLPPPPPDHEPAAELPTLVGASDLWAFRIDARVGSTGKSWWAVYMRTSARWECVQRLVITD